MAGSDTGPPGRDEDRPLRGLHAILGDIRVHVRHRDNHHTAADSPFPGSARRFGPARGGGLRLARCAAQHRPQRVRHRRRHPCRGRGLAQPVQEVSASYIGGAGRRDAAGRVVVE